MKTPFHQVKTTLLLPILSFTFGAQAAPMPDTDWRSLQTVFGAESISRNIYEFDLQGLHHGESSKILWSDDYWAFNKGSIAKRYLDPHFPNSKSWKKNFEYIQSRPVSQVDLETLSPAEKYDLLMGDPSLGLTQFNWALGRKYYEKMQDVPAWMGIDHGWAAASIATPNPVRSVTLMSPEGKMITFTPSDIKALASALWANAQTETRFFGSRCNLDVCQDNDPNPATFHLLLTEKLGKLHESCVMDVVGDFEVWNLPVQSFNLRYWNVETGQYVTSLENAKSLAKDGNDHSPKAKWIVGIENVLTFANETFPSAAVQAKPTTRTLRYRYDLEIDENGVILGGQWHQDLHVDFMWFYQDTSLPLTAQDRKLNAQDLGKDNRIPPQWTKAAQSQSQKGSPLALVVQRLIELSQ